MNIRCMANKKILFIFLILLCGANITTAVDKTALGIIIFQQNKLVINAQNIPLMNILAEIQNQCAVKIEGLENRKDEPVTYFSKKESLENVLKSFLRHLGEKNYAFEFVNQKLKRIAVMPKAYSDNLVSDTRADEQENQADTVKVVKVVEVIERSQAQSTGLMKDDLILEYDGVKIHSANELIKLTKDKSNTDQVAISVLRENYRLQFIINGGFVGVRIRDVLIAKEDLAVF